MTPVTLFSYITPEEQERMRICFDMHEAVYRNNETVMEYSSSMKKIGLILEGQAVLYCIDEDGNQYMICLLYTSPSPRDRQKSRMPSSA